MEDSKRSEGKIIVYNEYFNICREAKEGKTERRNL
jgi:hypothetical protein